ncbi:MAG: bifunctional 2-polyprenyl-6-hydroxyphenol methylase/3-demethylubiquinol 3-O-methyltransferase UbiG [Spirochaetes bacterium]|nr:bifunctional 2-polyprenyl-6-hydroxyphenol methylase/3-demethylubiquinol 3-O-methyltransferase UbiG [Spirochaetota bacterium]
MIDNKFYDREAKHWWSGEDSPLMLIRYTVHPLRLQYVLEHLGMEYLSFEGLQVLDVGCGGGFLTEEIAKYGLKIVGIDPSLASLEAARSHAEKIGLRIEYLEGIGERIPFPDSFFDIVFCCDVLEHMNDYQEVLKEVKRVLRPGGWLFFETINRTLLSFFVVVFLLQECEFTSIIPRNIHCWENFIKPEELLKTLKALGFQVKEIVGIMPGWNFLYHILLLRKRVKQQIGYEKLCKFFKCHTTKYTGLCYLGCAWKAHP